MAIRKSAKIIVELDRLGYEQSKYFIGTEDEVLAEAHDWMHSIALQFIDENDIEDPFEQDLIIDCASHTIVWDEWDITPIIMFAVYENDTQDPVFGIYTTRADAEEAILTECETFAYEVMMTDDPEDVIGCDEWDWHYDYKWLMRDAGRTFSIQEVPVYI
ncbi:MAG: hypothetical protein J6V44_08375 [Methanobrevibacter sp.]|nr:hypothetical protein [Methanobrevibacter sp.]